MNSPELNKVIEGCVAWDRRAQETLYRLFSKSVFKTCRLYADSDDDAADFLHDIFIHVFKKIEQYKATGNFESWIKRIAINHCLQEIKLKKRFINSSLNNLQTEIVDEDFFEQGDKKRFNFNEVLNEINKLPYKASLVLKLYVLENWSHAEIAQELGISVGTSKSQLNYARTVLKNKCYAEF